MYSTNNPAKFHPDPVLNDRTLGFFYEMTSWPPAKIRLRQLVWIFMKNISAKYHPDPIRNNRVTGYFWRGHPKQKQEKEEEEDE